MSKLKSKTNWVCQECGHQSFQWAGQCPACKNWNSLQEELPTAPSESRYGARDLNPLNKPVALTKVQAGNDFRIATKLKEFNRLLGGGLTKGSLSLIGGEPGIGKSTLLLQVAFSLADQNMKVLYVCGEESVNQTAVRAERLSATHDNLFLLNETCVDNIITHIEQLNPDFLIIDSIQIVYKSEITSSPGSVAQVRECTSDFMHLAKARQIPTFLIGHVTKSGEIAGPRVLEHLVDTVLYFEGDRQNQLRLVRVVKNRFGATDEVAVFQMGSKGLKEVDNPSEIFLEERKTKISGSAIIPTLEGSRPILVEVQSLVSNTVFPSPSRKSTGIDSNRLALLLAVLEKRMRYKLYACDVFVSVVGGMKVSEPAADLGVLLAIAASYRNKVIDPEVVVMGEVGLGGEIRSISRIESRIKEAQRMGFKTCFIPKRSLKNLDTSAFKDIKLHGVEMVEEVMDALVS
ncbi:MAG: DNA repair protein RadA [Chlamydiales bacterium]|nr:DNA repair protein RadA [Chlamydiales bacterium]